MPLGDGGYGVGRVARMPRYGKVLLCYLFGPRREQPPTLEEVDGLQPEHAVLVGRLGDLGLMNGNWPILGDSTEWNRERWPIPPFIRRDPLSERAWRAQYPDDNPNDRPTEEPIEYSCRTFGPDSVWGYGAAEYKLLKRLTTEGDGEGADCHQNER